MAPRILLVRADHSRHPHAIRMPPRRTAAQFGEQTVQLARIVASSIPSRASRSMCGVRTSVGPCIDTSP